MTSAVANKVDSLVQASGARTRLDTIRAVHRWVAQDVRYVSVSLGIGGYQPRMPADVVASGFGDCKDKATLFVAAMRRYKINANPVLLALGGRPDPALPSVFQFNHAIAAVQDGAGWTFTDLTAEFVPYGAIPDAYQAQFGIVVLENGHAQDVRFPATSVTASGSSLRVRMTLDSTGHVTGSVVEETLGGPSSGMRAAFSAPLDSARREGLEKALAQRLFASDVTVSSITAFDGKDFSIPTALRYTVIAENTLKPIGENRLFPFRVIETRRRPAFHFLARVKSFAHEKITFADRTVARDLP